jgi:hypothetical protein
MIDLQSEDLITLAEAMKRIPPARRGRKTHLSTLVRWITEGARAPDGTRVRLEAVRVGARWMTTIPALQRFVERLTPAVDQPPAERGRPRSPTSRERASRRAEQALEKAGI